MSTTVFISSTSRDLLDHRAAVAKALLNAGFHPIDMANFMARPEGATSACLKEVAEADLFVGIYAWRYGYIPAGSNVSITEQEFIEAERLGKPCFCFVVDETYDWNEEHKEGGHGADLLRDFKARLDTKLVRTTFTTPNDLAMKVLASLQRWERNHPQDTPTIAAEPAQPPAATDPIAGGVNISGISGGSLNLGNIVSGDVGGDVVGGDKVIGDKVGGDKIVGIARVQDQAIEQLKVALASWQKDIEARIEGLSDLDDEEKEDLKKNVSRVANEAVKGEKANFGKIERWFNTIGAMAPDILEVTAKTLQNPFAGVGLVMEKISDRIKLERQQKT